MKVAIYARVSTLDQNCDLQDRELREFLDRRAWGLAEISAPSKWTVHEFKPRPDKQGKPTNECATCRNVALHALHTGRFAEYVDSGWSGTKASRPELNRLKQDAREKRFDCVIVWKLDRWGRSVTDSLASIKELRRLGIRWIAITQNLDTDQSNPMAELMLNIMAAFAEFEREMIRERTMAGAKGYLKAYEDGEIGKTRNSRSGKNLPPGRPKRIFRRDEAAKLREMGHSWRAISKQLGVPASTLREALSC